MDESKSVVQDQTLIFLHMPKAAGTTLGQIVTRQYGRTSIRAMGRSSDPQRELASLTDAERRKIRLLIGHMPFGLHEYLAEPVTYITTLRDPVDRVISHYFHARRNPQSPLYAMVQDVSLEEFVRSGMSGETDNRMSRILTGEWVSHGSGYSQPCSEERFEQAKENLDRWFTVVGLAERFDESVLLMKDAFGWRNVYYGKKNVTPGRPDKAEIPETAIRAIQELNSFDIALYHHAERKFLEMVEQQGPGFDDRVRRFQRLNRPVSAIYEPYDQLYQRLLGIPWARKTGLTIRRALKKSRA